MNQQNLRIKNPSVTLYAFHLRTEMSTEVVADAAHLWEKLTQLSEPFSIPELQQLPDELICYQNGQYYPDGEQGQKTDYLELIQPKRYLNFSPVAQTDDLTLRGFVYPLRLHDIYAVDFSLSFENQTLDVSHCHDFNPQACLLPNNIQASLGQTLLLYADPTEGVAADKTLADQCIHAFLQDFAQPELRLIKSEGQLFGSPIFEYEEFPKSDGQNPNELLHIWVWLAENEGTLSQATQANRWLINLLSCRHKILFAYHQANQSYHSARELYRELEEISQQLNELETEPKARLAKLESLLTKISSKIVIYASHLRNLKDHATTITTNTQNYASWLEEIRLFSLVGDNLVFLKDFHERDCQRYQQQMAVYLNYLEPGYDLFVQMLNTIRGMIDIESQKLQLADQKLQKVFEDEQRLRDRRLQLLIAFIGVAIGTGAISATTISNPPDLVAWISQLFEWVQLPLVEIPKPLNLLSLPTELLKIMFHLLVGGITAFLFKPIISRVVVRK